MGNGAKCFFLIYDGSYHKGLSTEARFCKDTEPSYNSYMYSLVSLLSSIYPLPAMHSLLVTLYVTEDLIGIY